MSQWVQNLMQFTARNLRRPLQACVISVAQGFILALSTVALAGGPLKAPAVCWSASELSGNKADQHIRKRVAEALITPPQRQRPDYSPLPLPQRGSIRRVKLPPGKKLIALTFDLCEQPDEIAGYQGEIVDFLRMSGVKATFFIGGKWMVTHGNRTQQLISDPLFEIGNHTWEHRNLRLLKDKDLFDEIDRANLTYDDVRNNLETKQCLRRDHLGLAHERAPKKLRLFRFPFGACSPEALKTVGDMGMLSIQWDISSGDPSFGQTAEMIKRDVLNRARPGSIVLFHANGRGWHTGGALPSIIAQLRKENYEFVTVSELLAAGEWEIAPTCFDNKPHDTERYDNLSRRLLHQYDNFKQLVTASRPLPTLVRHTEAISRRPEPEPPPPSQSEEKELIPHGAPSCDPESMNSPEFALRWCGDLTEGPGAWRSSPPVAEVAN